MTAAMPDKSSETPIEIAARLGRERFAARAARYDREASFPFENYDDLREAGLTALCVPRRYGGLVADFATYCLVSAELGRHCGASALTFNTGAPEVMELIEGRCRVKLAGQSAATEYRGGQSFHAPGNSSFEIETLETLHYVCHFG